MAKHAFLLLSSPQNPGKFANPLTYATQLADAGHEVVIYFDGAATNWFDGIDDRAPPVGVYVTPTHPPGPDIDASLLLLEAVQRVYGFTVDEKGLRARSEELKQYYRELAQRMESLGEGEQPLATREYPEDRMFM